MNGELEFLEEDHSYSINGIILPSVTQIIGKIIGDKFSRIDQEILEKARQRGKRVHSGCQLLDEDEQDFYDLDWQKFDDELEAAGEIRVFPYIESYKMWRDETCFIPIENEKRVAHKELGYAGTLDKKGLLFGELAIIDLKSGEVGPETAVQTAGYAIADGCVTAKRVGLQLRPGKIAKPTVFPDPMDIIAFKNFLGAYKWMVAHGC